MAEKSFVYETLLRFLDGYFIHGDREAVLRMSADDIYCIGVQGEAPAFNREEFDRLLRRHIVEKTCAVIAQHHGRHNQRLAQILPLKLRRNVAPRDKPRDVDFPAEKVVANGLKRNT